MRILKFLICLVVISSLMSCKKVETAGEYTISFTEDFFYYTSPNNVEKLSIDVSSRGKVVFGIYKGDLYSNYRLDDDITVNETSDTAIEFVLHNKVYGIGIVAYLVAEGEVQASDTCWFDGVGDFDYANKIFFRRNNGSSGLSYYKESTKEVGDFTPTSYTSLGIYPNTNMLFEQNGSSLYVRDIRTGNELAVTYSLGRMNHVNNTTDFIGDYGYYSYGGGTYNLSNLSSVSGFNNAVALGNSNLVLDACRVNGENVVVYADNANYSTDKSTLYLQKGNQSPIELGNISRYDDYTKISISEDGSFAYCYDEESGSIKRFSLMAPYVSIVVFSDWSSISSIDASPNGDKVVVGKSSLLFIVDAMTLDTTNLPMAGYNPIWK